MAGPLFGVRAEQRLLRLLARGVVLRLLLMQQTTSPGIDEAVVAAIAAEAEADPRSVWKRLAGGKVRGRVGARIDRAIAAYLAKKDPQP
jgi:hypothetical protein